MGGTMSGADNHPDNAPLLIVLSAPSGVGKSTIAKKLEEQGYGTILISTTTRLPRPSEVEGKHYFYISEEAFFEKIEKNQFFEWAKIYDHYYGTNIEQLDMIFRQNKNAIFEINTEGAKKVKSKLTNVVSIFIEPPSIEELYSRITKRNEDDPEIIKLRMQAATAEIAHKDWYDYAIVNDSLEVTIENIKDIISKKITKEHKT